MVEEGARVSEVLLRVRELLRSRRPGAAEEVMSLVAEVCGSRGLAAEAGELVLWMLALGRGTGDILAALRNLLSGRC